MFLIWCIVVSASEAVLKAMLLGCGSDTLVLINIRNKNASKCWRFKVGCQLSHHAYIT